MSKNKDTYYFSHDSNARNDEKILAIRMRHRAEGYAVYFMILERLRECTDNMSVKDYNVLAFDFRVSADLVKSVVENYGLFVFTDDGKHFYSERMQRNMEIVKAKSEKAKQAVKKRWEKQKKDAKEIPPKNESNTNVIQTYNERNTIKGKEKKVKETKEEKNKQKNILGVYSDFFDEVLKFFSLVSEQHQRNAFGYLARKIDKGEIKNFAAQTKAMMLYKKQNPKEKRSNWNNYIYDYDSGKSTDWVGKVKSEIIIENPDNEPIITYNDNVNPTKRQMPKSKFEQMQERNKAGGYVYKVLKVSNGN